MLSAFIISAVASPITTDPDKIEVNLIAGDQYTKTINITNTESNSVHVEIKQGTIPEGFIVITTPTSFDISNGQTVQITLTINTNIALSPEEYQFELTFVVNGNQEIHYPIYATGTRSPTSDIIPDEPIITEENITEIPDEPDIILIDNYPKCYPLPILPIIIILILVLGSFVYVAILYRREKK
jgi:hypothetical protein